MLRHIVLCRFRPEISDVERRDIFAGIAALKDHLSGISNMHFGPNASAEQRSQGFDDGFIIDFADDASLEAYLDDPAHKEAGARMVAALDGGRETGLIVFDMSV